jgi:hypothetical protein
MELADLARRAWDVRQQYAAFGPYSSWRGYTASTR